MRQILRLAAALAALFPAPLLANDVEGAWSDVFAWPVTAIHMSLLHTGHIVLWSVDGDDLPGWGEPFLLDPTNDCFDQADGCFTEKPNPANIFCGGHAQLSDGSLLVNGGHVRNDVGLADTFLFHYDREASDWNWTPRGELPDSHYARWYSTLTTLADGRVLNVSGSEKRCAAASVNAEQLCLIHTDCGTDEEALCEVRLVAPPEVFDPATREWTLIDTIDEPVQYYPFNFVAPTGEVYFAGADVGADTIYIPSISGLYFDVEGGGINPTGQVSTTDGGSAVMYRPGQMMKCGGTMGSGEAIQTAEVINLNVSDQWNPATPMNIPRRRHNLTLLPDGTVLVTGGTRLGNREFTFDGTCGGGDEGTPCNNNDACDEGVVCSFNPSGEQQWVSEAEIWDPDADEWTVMAGAQTPRLYHSSALLLPDGRVISAGGGPGRPRPFGGAFNTYTDAEIFSPPYLYRDSERPVIDDVPEIIHYGNAFEVISEQAPDVEAVNLIRLGAVTHSFDQNTRFIPLSFAQGIDDTLDVQAPPNGNIAPPGYYMLFLVSSDGVPSVARFVRILPPDPGANALYEYSAKIICGRQAEDPLQRAAGFYATSVNIHNPFPAPIRFFKKLALTAPPGMQQPGKILPIGEDVLSYDSALQTDCRELRQKLISTEEAPVIEGFLVIQSPRELDVTSVYTTSALANAAAGGAHSSIDVESVSVRRRASSDLSITKSLIPCPEPEPVAGGFETSLCDRIYTSGDTVSIGFHFRLFEVVVTNNGPDPATGILINDELLLDYDPAVATGGTIIWGEEPIELPVDTEFTVQQPAFDRSRAEISLPDLEPGQAHTMRFWTVTVWGAEVNAMVNLVNTANANVMTIDPDSLNNSAAATAPLNP